MVRSLLRLDLLLFALTILALSLPWPMLHWVAAPLLICVWPGVACARWLGQPLDWRDARTWAVVLIGSVALSPLIVFASSWLLTFSRASAILSIGAVIAAMLLSAPRPSAAPHPIYFSRHALLLMAFTLLIVFVALVPIQNAYRVSILPMAGAFRAGDWHKHYGLVWEIEASGVPPKNLFFQMDPPRIHPYYIFFHLTTALLDLLSNQTLGINFWLVVSATIAAATCLLAVYVLAHCLWHNDVAAVGSLVCVSLLGGLDVIPSLFGYIDHTTDAVGPYLHLEGWDGCLSEVSSFFTMYTWVPQHIVSLSAILLGWLIYQSYPKHFRAVLIIVLLVVGAVGYSIYVPIGIILGGGLFFCINVIQSIRTRSIGSDLRRTRSWFAAGICGLVIALPLVAYELSGRQTGADSPVSLWVRTEGIPIRGLPTATLFQWLFPQGGLIAQWFDLPLYYLYELGATLLLALIGFVVWRKRWSNRLWLIGMLAAAASLVVSTFVRSNLGCNDLGLRAAFPFQVILALWAGGGWMALFNLADAQANVSARSEHSATVMRHAYSSRAALMAALFAAAIGACIIFAAYQRPLIYRVDVAHSDDVLFPISGLYARESADDAVYRWTKKHVTLSFNGLPQNAPHQLIVRAAAGNRPSDAPLAFAVVWVNGFAVGQFTASETPQSFAFDVPLAVLRGQNSIVVELGIAPYRPDQFSLGDRRELGLLLDSITLNPLAAAGPIVWPSWDMLAAVMVLSFFARLLNAKRSWLVEVNLFLLLSLFLARPLVTPALPYAALLLGTLWFARDVMPRILHWVAAHVLAGSTHPLIILLAPFVLLSVLTTLWQVFTFDIGKFLPSYNAQLAEQDGRSIVYNDALQFIRTQTPKDIVLQIDPHLMGHDLGIGLASERTHFYYLDQVFNYQFTAGRLDARRGQIEQAFQMPTMNEACGRFQRLKIDIILLEQARAYSWLADIAEPESCFKRLYQNEMVTILEIVR